MKDLSWKTLSSEYLYKDTWFTIRKDTCETQEGKIVTPYYVYEFPTWVTALALTTDGKVIMERQYRHALGQTNYEIPGGCVDDTDPSLEFAIRRELMEETGYEFEQFEYLGRKSYNPKNKGKKSYQPILTFLAETREYVGGELHNGDRPTGQQIARHLESVFAALPQCVRQKFARADAGF